MTWLDNNIKYFYISNVLKLHLITMCMKKNIIDLLIYLFALNSEIWH